MNHGFIGTGSITTFNQTWIVNLMLLSELALKSGYSLVVLKCSRNMT